MFLDNLPLVRSASEIADLNDIFDKIGEALIIVDKNWRVRYVNDVYFRYSQLRRQEVEGRIVFDFAPTFRQSIFFESIERAISENRETRKISFSPVLKHWMRVRSVPYDDGVAVFMRTASEDSVTEHLRAESAVTDPVTGLRNKIGMEDVVKQLLGKRAPFFLMLIGVEGLKPITDNHGYAAGDMCMLELAALLRNPLQPGDTLYRITSDEFGVLAFGDEDSVLERAGQLRSAVETPITLPSARALLTASIGVASGMHHGEDFEILLKRSSLALTRARKARLERVSHPETIRMFQPALELEAVQRMQLQDELRAAQDGRDFRLLIQPKVSLATGAVAGGETLLRWDHPRLGRLSPGVFLDIAADIGVMQSIDRWVLRHSVKAAKELQQRHVPVPISINIGTDSLDDALLPSMLADLLQEFDLPPHLIEIEIPEGALMHDVDRSIAILTELSAMGLKLSIDDFGTGYSSFSYLAEFPVHTLKIDRSFISELTRSKAKRTIVQSIIKMAHHLSLEVVAEGAEDDEQVRSLRSMECDKIQGYVFARPLEIDAFVEFAKANSPTNTPDAETL
ncbi:MAG: hypothetical protein RI988_2321 [Pseudomonadota bacterium]